MPGESFTSKEDTMQGSFAVNYENTPFLTTGKIFSEAISYRLNWRCEILLTRNQEAIKGKRILDLASHDGMFSYACLKLGAGHVTGVEGRGYLIKSAIDNLSGLGYTPEQFNFIQDDVFDYLAQVKPGEFDTILCFGIFYHTVRQFEMLREIKRIHPTHFILDTFLQRGFFINPVFMSPSHLLALLSKLRFRHFRRIPATLGKVKDRSSYEPVGPFSTKQGRPCLIYMPEVQPEGWGTIDPLGLVAWPTQSFLELAFKSYGMSLKRLHWDKKEIKNWVSIRDYKIGTRASYITQPLD
jgi:hypothetical protein